MSLPLLLLLPLFSLLLVALMLWHARVPRTMEGYCMVQAAELFMRIGMEYLGDIIESLFGARTRNVYIRRFMSVMMSRPIGKHDDVKISTVSLRGTSTRVYTPRERKSDAAVVFIHGGGWCAGSAKNYDDVVISMTRRLGCVIFSIDYELAPEVPFPGPADECEAVVRELYENKYVEYGVSRDRIALIGDSAGGNLTAVTANRLLRDGCRALKCSVLIYPVTQAIAFDLPCHQLYYSEYNNTGLLNPRSMARFCLMYMDLPAEKEDCDKLLRMQHISREMREDPVYSFLDTGALPKEMQTEPVPTEEVVDAFTTEVWKRGTNPDISPLFEKSLKGQCPTMLVTAGWDVLRDEGIMYGKRLEKEGVNVEWKHYPQTFHGSFNLKRRMFRDVVQYLSTHL